jgi:predicted GNAT family acetyltransferase
MGINVQRVPTLPSVPPEGEKVSTIKTLETAAIDAHARGDTWGMFWEQHGAEVCRAEPHAPRGPQAGQIVADAPEQSFRGVGTIALLTGVPNVIQ